MKDAEKRCTRTLKTIHNHLTYASRIVRLKATLPQAKSTAWLLVAQASQELQDYVTNTLTAHQTSLGLRCAYARITSLWNCNFLQKRKFRFKKSWNRSVFAFTVERPALHRSAPLQHMPASLAGNELNSRQIRPLCHVIEALIHGSKLTECWKSYPTTMRWGLWASIMTLT